MDFRNLCHKINVDSLKARIPPMPAIPQIKLPKSMPKLKSRKIFRSSRENVNTNSTGDSMKRSRQQLHSASQDLAPSVPPSEFINHTPMRISTISSLMHQKNSEPNMNTYRNACSIDDDYPSPRRYSRSASKPISPVRTPINFGNTPPPAHYSGGDSTSINTAKMSLGEKLQKGYKDLTEFRLKNIFVKKTVVRRDNIVVDHYVKSYNEDRIREEEEEERRDREIADNYRIKFKESRQNTGHTNSISSEDSPVHSPPKRNESSQVKNKIIPPHSDDESGMDEPPPARKQGIAATRFAKVRNPPLRQSMSEDSNLSLDDDDNVEQILTPTPNSSSLWAIRETRKSAEPSPKAPSTVPKARASNKQHLQRQISSYDDSGAESNAETTASSGAKMMTKLRGIGGKRNVGDESKASGDKKRKAPLTPQQSEEGDTTNKSVNDNAPLATKIKQNFKRFQKSIKREQASADDSEDDEATTQETNKPGTKAERFAARLRRMKSREPSAESTTTTPKKDDATNKSPLRSAITNKLQTWKKSFKKNNNENSMQQTGNEASPEKPPKRSDTLIKKLKHMRSRNNLNSTDDLNATDDEVEGNTSTKTSKDTSNRKPMSFEGKFEQARQRTLKKVNEKMHQMKFFHKSQEQIGTEKPAPGTNNSSVEDDDYGYDQDDEKEKEANIPAVISKRSIRNSYRRHSSVEETGQIQLEYSKQTTHAVWTTRKPMLSDSMESDLDTEFPRVLIHQDNTDTFESTLIIAVTRPATPSVSPIITEIPVEKCASGPISPKPVEWISNRDIISNFLEVTPPIRQTLSANLDAIAPGQSQQRKLSADSYTDSESWIPPEVMRSKANSLNCTDESEEPWRVQTGFRDKKLYKAKSIDIFEANAKRGGVTTAFEDFDDELKNEPIVKISKNPPNVDSFEKDSSEDPDAPDDDNSSRVTKILMRPPPPPPPSQIRDGKLNDKKRQNSSVDTMDSEDDVSQQSLIANFDAREENDSDYDDDNDDRPPSSAPSPPPSYSPPPPPLPQRNPAAVTILMATAGTPPPLPRTKPPVSSNTTDAPKVSPPKIPERTESMARVVKPLVKTASLRLAYSEQVNPTDIGKVNKLISQFEKPKPLMARPRIIPRRTFDDEDYDDDEEDDNYSDECSENDNDRNNNNKIESKTSQQVDHDTTPTPTNTPKKESNEIKQIKPTTVEVPTLKRPAPLPIVAGATNLCEINALPRTTINLSDKIANNNNSPLSPLSPPLTKRENSEFKTPINIPKVTLEFDRNSNYSRHSSEYGSPLEYPSSLIGSTATTPTQERKQDDFRYGGPIRSRRSMTRDDDNFLSFDSDDENSYYSISSTSSNRHVVEI